MEDSINGTYARWVGIEITTPSPVPNPLVWYGHFVVQLVLGLPRRSEGDGSARTKDKQELPKHLNALDEELNLRTDRVFSNELLHLFGSGGFPWAALLGSRRIRKGSGWQ